MLFMHINNSYLRVLIFYRYCSIVQWVNVSIILTLYLPQLEIRIYIEENTFNPQFHFFHNWFTHLTKISQSRFTLWPCVCKNKQWAHSEYFSKLWCIKKYVLYISKRHQNIVQMCPFQRQLGVYQSSTYLLIVDRLHR